MQRLGPAKAWTFKGLDLQRLSLQRLGSSKAWSFKGKGKGSGNDKAKTGAKAKARAEANAKAKATIKAETKATNINKSLAPEVGFTSPALEKQHNSHRPSLNRLLTHLGACYKMHTLAGLQTGYQGKKQKTKAKQEAKAKAEAKAAAKRQRQNKNRTLGIEPKACKAWTFKG